MQLLQWCARNTAMRLHFGETLTASKQGFTLIGCRDSTTRRPFSVMMLRAGRLVFQSEADDAMQAAVLMLKVWNTLNRQLAAQQAQGPWRRQTLTA